MIGTRFEKSIEVDQLLQRTRFPIVNFNNFIDYLGGLENISSFKRHENYEFTDSLPDIDGESVVKKRYVITLKDPNFQKELPPRPGEEKPSLRYCIEQEFDYVTKTTVYKFPEIIDATCLVEGFEGEKIVIKTWGQLCDKWIEPTARNFEEMKKLIEEEKAQKEKEAEVVK